MLPINHHTPLLTRWADNIISIFPKRVYWKKTHFFFHRFSRYVDLLFDSLLKHVIAWFTVNFISKNTEAIFLSKVFRCVCLLYAVLDQFFAVELVLVRIFGQNPKSKSAHWRIFLKVSESVLMVLAINFVPFSLIGVVHVCYSSDQENDSAKTSFKKARRSPFHSTSSLDNR